MANQDNNPGTKGSLFKLVATSLVVGVAVGGVYNHRFKPKPPKSYLPSPSTIKLIGMDFTKCSSYSAMEHVTHRDKVTFGKMGRIVDELRIFSVDTWSLMVATAISVSQMPSDKQAIS